jgi:hypothetical protein
MVPTYSLIKTVIGRLIVVSFIAFFFDWVASPLLILIGVSSLLLTLLDLMRRKPGLRVGLIRSGIYLCGALTAFFLHNAKISNAEKQADQLVQAIERYREGHRTYPEKLEALVPEFYSEVPRSPFGRYIYSRSETGRYFINYVEMAPGGVRSYSSESKTWSRQAR